MDPLLLRVEDAAEALGIGRATLYRLISAGAIGTVKVGRRRLVPVEALQALVDARLAGEASPGRGPGEVPA